MAIEHNLKIFISWSGELSREIAKVLRSWLPSMFDHIEPWASPTDIDAGVRNLELIAKQLRESGFGIVIITTDNMNKTWLNFEAGALSNHLDNDKHRVVPLLVNFDDFTQLTTPLNQFQAIMLDEAGVRALCRSLARVMGLDLLAIDSRFNRLWPDLDAAAQKVIAEIPSTKPENPSAEELIKQLLSRLNEERTLPVPYRDRLLLNERRYLDANTTRANRDNLLRSQIAQVASNKGLPIKGFAIEGDPDSDNPDDGFLTLTVYGDNPTYSAMESLAKDFQAVVNLPVKFVSTSGGTVPVFYPS